jgi:hypothetical protein
MSKPPLRQKLTLRSLSPTGGLKLDTLAHVRVEMARIYRLALNGTIEPEKMTKLIYALKEIRSGIESGLLDEAPRRLDELRTKVEGRGQRSR